MHVANSRNMKSWSTSVFCAGTGVAADASGLRGTVKQRQRNDPGLPETIQDAASGPKRAQLLRLLGSGWG